MELQNYLRTKGLQSLCDEFKIKVNRHARFNNLVCLKYCQIESPLAKKIVQQCRGIILDELNNWSLVSYPYDKFFNYGESAAASLNWNTARVYDKLDGSLMTLYYYQKEWRVQSSGTADGSGNVGGFQYNFSQLFWKVWQEKGYQLPQETDCCFMFELMTPYNRIVVRHDRNKLVLHGVRNIKTKQEDFAETWGHKYGWEVAKTYPLQSLKEIIAVTNNLDPLEGEGYIVCDDCFNRIKVKSPQYVAISHLRTGFSTRKLIEIIVTNEGEEFLNYYPEWQEFHDRVKTKYEALVLEIESAYDKYRNIAVQKDFALAVKHLPYSGILFALRAGKTDSVKQSLQNTSVYKLENLLEIDFVELS